MYYYCMRYKLKFGVSCPYNILHQDTRASCTINSTQYALHSVTQHALQVVHICQNQIEGRRNSLSSA